VRGTVVGTDILAQACSSRPSENSRNSLRFLLERLPRRAAVFLSDEQFAQARPPRLSESSRNLPGALSQSRLSESLQLEREHSSRLSEDSQLERDLAWFLLCFDV